jgi:hypothetical protein
MDARADQADALIEGRIIAERYDGYIRTFVDIRGMF